MACVHLVSTVLLSPREFDLPYFFKNWKNKKWKYFNNTRARQRIQYKSFEFENKVHVHNELTTAAISLFFIQAMMLPT